jgi:hypothetical protein
MALPTRKWLIWSVSAVTKEICHQKRTLRAATAQVLFGSLTNIPVPTFEVRFAKHGGHRSMRPLNLLSGGFERALFRRHDLARVENVLRI